LSNAQLFTKLGDFLNGLYQYGGPHDSYRRNRRKQELLFQKNGFSRKQALKRLSSVCLDLFERPYEETNGMFSEHLVLFSAVSISNNDVKNILEIGTFDGRTTAILAKLFPLAQIKTIDLPSDDEQFVKSYNREQTWGPFVEARDRLLRGFPNIEFLAINSLNLTNWEGSRFDLIWVDGAHGYPVIAADIINAYRLVLKNGLVMIDDVYARTQHNDSMYTSIGSFETLNAMESAGMINSFALFSKRLRLEHNPGGRKKYVAYFRKPSTETQSSLMN
jgi:predicted O-methyltransferase YrrM